MPFTSVECRLSDLKVGNKFHGIIDGRLRKGIKIGHNCVEITGGESMVVVDPDLKVKVKRWTRRGIRVPKRSLPVKPKPKQLPRKKYIKPPQINNNQLVKLINRWQCECNDSVRRLVFILIMFGRGNNAADIILKHVATEEEIKTAIKRLDEFLT